MNFSFSDLIPVLIGITLVAMIVYISSRDLKKALVVFGSWGIYEFCNFFYDFLFWAYVQEKYGVWGSLCLILGAGIMNISFLYMYLHGRMDLFGFGTVDQVVEKVVSWASKNSTKTGARKLVSVFVGWLARKNDIVSFFVLSVGMDSFVTTAYLRHGNFNTKMGKKDWFVFIGSTLLSGVIWGGFIEVLVLLIKVTIRFFS